MTNQQHITSTAAPSIIGLDVAPAAPLQLAPPAPVALYGQRVQIEGQPGYWWLCRQFRGFLEVIEWAQYKQYKDWCWNIWDLPRVKVLPNRTVTAAPVPPRVKFVNRAPVAPAPLAPVAGAPVWAVAISAIAIYTVMRRWVEASEFAAAFNAPKPPLPQGFTPENMRWFKDQQHKHAARYIASHGGEDEFSSPYTRAEYAEV